MPWQFISAEDVGGRAEQQDRLAVLHRESDDTHLAVVADGVGGHGNGALAAQTVIDVAAQRFSDAGLDDPEQFLEQLCLDADAAVRQLDGDSSGASCSTCVFLLVRDCEAYWAHVGDSRLYLLRGKQVQQQTRDHSLLRLQTDAGEAALAGHSPASANALYMCLGGGSSVVPEVSARRVSANDVFLLCSDGFWGQLELDEVNASLRSSRFEPALAHHWVEQAKRAGGASGDNITVVMVRLEAAGQGAGGLFAALRRLFRPGSV